MKSVSSVSTYWIYSSPVGRLLLQHDGKGLSGLQFQDGAHPLAIDEAWKKRRSPFIAVITQLDDYFSGRLQKFSIPLSLHGTAFQLSVWRALRTIPYGQTVSYGIIAKKIGNPQASRAVGAANGQNPVSIIVPCHRIIGANGKLVGYGGGLPIKKALLELEQNTATSIGSIRTSVANGL